jgi:hypothetical protein
MLFANMAQLPEAGSRQNAFAVVIRSAAAAMTRLKKRNSLIRNLEFDSWIALENLSSDFAPFYFFFGSSWSKNMPRKRSGRRR